MWRTDAETYGQTDVKFETMIWLKYTSNWKTIKIQNFNKNKKEKLFTTLHLRTDLGDWGIFSISFSRLALYSSRIFDGLFDLATQSSNILVGLFDLALLLFPDFSVNCKNSLFSMVSSLSVIVVLV